MTLEQLHVLNAIVKTGSFRAASVEMHKAQSAISYAIKTLEDELGFALFNRSSYRPQLTAQGRSYVKKSQELLLQLQELDQTAEFLKRGHEPVIRISLSPLFPLPSLNSVIKEFKKQFPLTEVHFVHDILSNDEKLMEDHVDIALGEIYNESGRIESRKITSVNMLVTVAPSHSLKKLKIPTPADLEKYPQIVLTSPTPSRRLAGISNAQNILYVEDQLTKMSFIECGLGWGRLPEHLLKDKVKTKSLVSLKVKPIVVPLYIARNPERELGPCSKFFWDHFSVQKKYSS